jgi:hypothetical protein
MLRPLTSSYQTKSTRTIAIDGVKLINKEGDPHYMEIRDAVEGNDHHYIDDGEEICCPICGIAWLTLDECDVVFDSCKHLRFCYHPDWDDFEFSNEWEEESFLELVENAREKDEEKDNLDDLSDDSDVDLKNLLETDEEKDILDILREIQHPDIDKALLYIWNEDPLNHPWMLWGYKDR